MNWNIDGTLLSPVGLAVVFLFLIEMKPSGVIFVPFCFCLSFAVAFLLAKVANFFFLNISLFELFSKGNPKV